MNNPGGNIQPVHPQPSLPLIIGLSCQASSILRGCERTGFIGRRERLARPRVLAYGANQNLQALL